MEDDSSLGSDSRAVVVGGVDSRPTQSMESMEDGDPSIMCP